MGFIWSGLDEIAAQTTVEMRDAVDNLTDTKQAPRFNWQQDIPMPDDAIELADFTEIQAAADYAQDRNVCLSDKATFYTSYHVTENSIDNAAKDVTQDVAKNITIKTAHDVGYDANLNSSYYGSKLVTYKTAYFTTYYSTQDNSRYNWDDSHAGSCFVGASLTYNDVFDLVRADSVKVGDKLVGAHGDINTVLAIDKVVLGNRSLYQLKGTQALFTLEHPFLLSDGTWGAFDKRAIDHEIEVILQKSNNSIDVIVDGEEYLFVRNFDDWSQDVVKQIDNSMQGLDIHDNGVDLGIARTDVVEEYIYSFVMSGSRTWNVEGIVISGVALGSEPTLVKKG